MGESQVRAPDTLWDRLSASAPAPPCFSDSPPLSLFLAPYLSLFPPQPLILVVHAVVSLCSSVSLLGTNPQPRHVLAASGSDWS